MHVHINVDCLNLGNFRFAYNLEKYNNNCCLLGEIWWNVLVLRFLVDDESRRIWFLRAILNSAWVL